jgi:hypothetical protein
MTSRNTASIGTTRRRLLRFIERSVPAYASDAELLRVAAELSGARRGE